MPLSTDREWLGMHVQECSIPLPRKLRVHHLSVRPYLCLSRILTVVPVSAAQESAKTGNISFTHGMSSRAPEATVIGNNYVIQEISVPL